MKNLYKIFLTSIFFLIAFNCINAQSIFTVTKTTDPDPFVYPYKFDDSECAPEMYGTLQWAIRKSNDTGGACTINFDIETSAPYKIRLNNYLPVIESRIILDATTQPGYVEGTPIIIIEANNFITTCFSAYGVDELTIKGFSFHNFIACGISLENCNYSTISDNIVTLINSNFLASKIGLVRIRLINCTNINVFNNQLNTSNDGSPIHGPDNYGIAIYNSENCTIGADLNSNLIEDCATGIMLDDSQNIRLIQNEIYGGTYSILLNNGSNNNKREPFLLNYNDGTLNGVAQANDIIEVFGSDDEDDATAYLGTAIADDEGKWSLETTNEYFFFTATATDANNNTSELCNVGTTSSICSIPFNLSSTPGIDTTHTLSWESDNLGSEFQIAVGVKGISAIENEWIFAYTIVTGNSITLNGFDENTIYEFYVQEFCDAGVGHFVGPFEFNKTCNSAEISGLSSINVGQQIQLLGTGSPANENAWAISNTTIATITEGGLVTGLLAGTTIITYTDLTGCTTIEDITVIEDRQRVESHRLFLKVNDSTLNLNDHPDFLNNFGIIAYEKPFISLNSDYMRKLFRITLNDTIDIEKDNIISRLNEISFVDFSEPIPITYDFMDNCVNPSDPEYQQGNQDYLERINSQQACQFYFPDYESREPTIIGIVEWTGVFILHEDLAGNASDMQFNAASLIIEESDEDTPYPTSQEVADNPSFSSHGTHVAGIAGAKSNNSLGVYSVGWNNKIMGILTADMHYGIDNTCDGILWAVENGAKVINMSWGVNVNQTLYNLLIDIKSDYSDVIFVAAAGNYNTSTPNYPAAYGNGYNTWEVEYDPELVIAVAAIDNEDEKRSSSSYGEWVDISTYGEGITSTVIDVTTDGDYYLYGEYAQKSGTSMAAPIISGIAGHMISYKPEATPEEIYSCLINTANDDIYSGSTNNVTGTLGSGRVDAEAALKCLGGDCSNGEPIAIITPSYPVLCPEGEVILSANGDETCSWEWSTTETTQSITVSTPAAYYVTVTFDTGCTASTVYKLNLANMFPEITAIENSHHTINDGIACLRDNITLHASYGLQYEWSNDLWPDQQNIDISNQHPTNFTAHVTIHDIDGCVGYDATASIDLEWDGFMADAGIDINSCYGEEILLVANPLGTQYTYTWNLKENATMAADIMETWYGPEVLIDYEFPYTFIDLVMLNEETGCHDKDVLKINLIDPLHDEIVFNELYNNIFCEDSDPYYFYYMHAEPGGGTWSGPGVTSFYFNPVDAGVGDHTITYTVGNENCNIQESVVFTVLDGEVDNFEITVIHEDNNPCSTTVAAYISGSCYGFDGEVVLILDGNVIFSNSNSSWDVDHPIIYEDLEPGSYNIVATDDLGGGVYTQEFTIYSPSLIELTASNTGPYCIGSTGEFFASENSNEYSYIWNTPNGNNYYNSLNYIDISSCDMHGEYSVTITDQNQCTFSASTFIEIEREPIITLTEITYAEGSNHGLVELSLTYECDNGYMPDTFQIDYINSQNQIVRTHQISGDNLPNMTGAAFLYADIYTVVVTSINDSGHTCQYTYTFELTDYSVSLESFDLLRTDCKNGANINIFLNIVDGVPPYTVDLWHYNPDLTEVSGDFLFQNPGYNLISLSNSDYNGYFQAVISDANNNQETFLINQDVSVITNSNIHDFSSYQDQSFMLGTEIDPGLIFNEDITFKNCRLYCSTYDYDDIEETLLIVKQGNTLTIDNSKLSSGCPDQMWNGIIVEGDWGMIPGPINSDPGPGQIIVKDNSIIEYAEKAIFSNHNGVVKVTDSRFTNCPIGVELANYNEEFLLWSTLPNLKPRTYIYKSEFETNEGFINAPIAHVRLYGVDKISLKGNAFANTITNNTLLGPNRGEGIYASNSSFSVNAYGSTSISGLLGPNAVISTFTGLIYGIHSENASTKTAKIEHCEFYDYSSMGVYLKNVTAPRITSNKFNKTLGPILTKNAGLYLKGCSAYKIENNTFNDGTIGMIINNSSNYTNKVYRNHFNNPRSGFHSYNTNSNQDGSQGLFIQCNDYHNNNGTQNWVKDGNIKRQQGFNHSTDNDQDISAANQFEIGNLIDNSESAFKVSIDDDSFNYMYWYNIPGDNTDITGFTSSNISVQPTYLNNDLNVSCPSKLTPFVIVDYEHEISRRKSYITNLNDNLDDIVDGGNTEKVLQKVQNLRPNKFNKTSRELLELSPYLSDTVLTTFMQTSVNGHVIAKTNILLANSPLPPNAKAELENMNLPTPHKNLIEQMQIGTNAVVQLKEEIGNIEFDKNLKINDYISHAFNNDSIPEVKDSVINFLINDDYFESKCLVIPILIADGRYMEAQTQINELDYLASSQNSALHTELSEFSELQEIVILSDTSTAENYLTIIESNLNLLEAIAYNPSHRGSSLAQILLSQSGIAEFEPEIFLPMEDRSMRFSLIEETNTESFDLDDLIEVYPTPASTEIWIEYLILKDKPVSRIDIYNIEGKLVLSQSIRSEYGIERIDISELSEGNYILKLGEFTKQISIMK